MKCHILNIFSSAHTTKIIGFGASMWATIKAMREIEIGQLRRVMSKPTRYGTLVRIESDKDGTFGTFTMDGGFQCYSLELPWAGNKPEVSCIPDGDYECVLTEKPKHGKCYEVQNVPGRTAILIHSANIPREILGCIALGRSIGAIGGIKAVTSSRDAINGFLADLDGESFTLRIRWAEGIKPKEAA